MNKPLILGVTAGIAATSFVISLCTGIAVRRNNSKTNSDIKDLDNTLEKIRVAIYNSGLGQPQAAAGTVHE